MLDVYERMKFAVKVKTNTELASLLELKSSSIISMWKKRAQKPYKECEFISKKFNVSLDWLLLGQGSMNRNDTDNTVIDVIQVPDHNKKVNMAEGDLLDTFRLLTDKQQQYLILKMKIFALENEFE